MGTVALILGIVGLVAWLYPVVGLPISIIGIIFGIIAAITKPPQRRKAIVGIILCLIGIILNLVVSTFIVGKFFETSP